jgi:hypothetical protein
MTQLEERLRNAAADVRRAGEQAVPRPITDGTVVRRTRPEWAIAGAIVVAGLLVGVALLLRPATSEDDVTTPSDSVPSNTTVIEGTATTSAAIVSTRACLDDDVTVPEQQEGLPEPVAAMRDRIIAAALACDGAALDDLGGANLDDPFTAGSRLEPSLRDIDQQHEPLEGGGDPPVLEIVLGILDTPPAEVTFGDGSPGFVWPAAAIYDTWADVPAPDMDALESVYPDPEGFAEHFGFDSYSGWRVGISAYGDWLHLDWGPYRTWTVGGEAVPECAGELMAAPGPQEGLPEPVAEIREQIIAAARACDVAALRELAGPDLVHDLLISSPGVDLLTTYMEDALARSCGYHRYPNQALACESQTLALLRALGTAPAQGVEVDLEGFAEALDKPAGEFSGLVWDDPSSTMGVGITPDGDWRFFVSAWRRMTTDQTS